MPETEKDLREIRENLGVVTLELKKAKDLLEAKGGEIEGVRKEGKEEATRLRTEMGTLKDSYTKLSTEHDEMLARLARPGATFGGNGASEKDREEVREAFNIFVRSGGREDALEGRAKELFLPIRSVQQGRALQVSSNELGGFLVPPVISGRMIEKVVEISPIRQVAMVTTIGSSDVLETYKETGTHTAAWVAELGTRAETEGIKFGKLKVPVHENYSLIPLSNQVIADAAIDLEAFIAVRAARQFAKSESLAFISGNGVGKPTGFLTRADVPTVTSTTGGTGKFTPDDVIDCAADLISTYAQRAQWLFHRKTVAFMRKFKDSQQRPLDLIQRDALKATTGGRGITCDGDTLYEAVDMPQVASGAKVGVFADWMEFYNIVDRNFMVALRDPFSQKLSGTVQWMFTRRVGGDVAQEEAGRILICQA